MTEIHAGTIERLFEEIETRKKDKSVSTMNRTKSPRSEDRFDTNLVVDSIRESELIKENAKNIIITELEEKGEKEENKLENDKIICEQIFKVCNMPKEAVVSINRFGFKTGKPRILKVRMNDEYHAKNMLNNREAWLSLPNESHIQKDMTRNQLTKHNELRRECYATNMEGNQLKYVYSANDPEYDRNLFDSADSGFSSDDSYGNRKAYECSNYYKLIRSNSLRSALKQPTPVVRTKSVRFADNVGLNLVEHSFYQAQDHADDFAHSNSYHSESVCAKRINAPKIAKYNGMQLVKQNFNNRTDTEIMRLIQNRRVILDSVKFVGMSITGVIDVLNLSPYKQVYVRFSLDGWHSSTDAQAKYVKSFDNSGAVDVFHFVISFSFDSPIDAKCEFCVLYVADNQSYWDNNCSQNFVVNLVAVKDNKIGLPPKCTTVIKRETTANNVSANKALPSRKKYDERRQEIRASEFAAKDFNLIDRKITKISTESDYLPVLPEEEGMRHPIGRRWKCSASYLLSTGSI